MSFEKNPLFWNILVALLFCSSFASAQVTQVGGQPNQATVKKKVVDKDSLKVVYFYDKVDSLNTTTYHNIDTLISNFQHYHPNLQPENPMAFTGNLGQASYPLIFKPFQTKGFDFGRHTFDPYIFNAENTAYFIPKRPFTVLNYVSGKAKEQIFEVVHGQSLTKGLYIGLDYKLFNSTGIYDKQQTNEYTLGVTLHFTRPDVRYQARANFITSLLKAQENGGLADLSVFEKNRETNRILLQVNLATAADNIHETGAYLHHSFYLGKIKPARQGNSFWTMVVNTFNAGTIGHILQYTDRGDRFVDTNPIEAYRPAQLTDSTKTHDTAAYRRLANTFYWTNHRDSTLQVLTLRGGIRYEMITTNPSYHRINYNQASPFGQFSLNAGPNIEVFGKVELTTGGYNDKDQEYIGGIKTHFGKKQGRQIAFEGEIYRTQTEPGYFYHLHNSNIKALSWDNTLVKTKTSGIRANLDVFGLHASVNFYNISDFVYLDTLGIARQSSQTANILQLSADYSLHLKGLTFRNVVTGQNIAGTSYIQLPQLVWNSTLSYRLDLFKSALSTESGVEMLYTSSFYGDAYNPALNMFYLQNNRKIGDYPYVDVFVNLKIKHTRFFVKYQHLNAAFSGYRYYLVPGYPQNDAAIKFGLSWIFYN